MHLCLQELLLALLDAVARLVEPIGGGQHALTLARRRGVVVVLQPQLRSRRRAWRRRARDLRVDAER